MCVLYFVLLRLLQKYALSANSLVRSLLYYQTTTASTLYYNFPINDMQQYQPLMYEFPPPAQVLYNDLAPCSNQQCQLCYPILPSQIIPYVANPDDSLRYLPHHQTLPRRLLTYTLHPFYSINCQPFYNSYLTQPLAITSLYRIDEYNYYNNNIINNRCYTNNNIPYIDSNIVSNPSKISCIPSSLFLTDHTAFPRDFVVHKEKKSLLAKHESLHMSNLENKLDWERLEKGIIELMVERIKERKILPSTESLSEYLFKDYTYTDDLSLMKQLTKWNSYNRHVIDSTGLTLSEAHVLLIKIESNGKKLPRITRHINQIYKEQLRRPSRPFDVMYTICILRSTNFSRKVFFMSFKENALENLDEFQFMKLFNMIISFIEENSNNGMYLCLDNLIMSLNFNKMFVLSSSMAFLISKKLLWLNNQCVSDLIFSESIRRAITLEDTVELLKYVRTDNCEGLKWFLRFYFLFSLKNKSNDRPITKIRALHSSFFEKYKELFIPRRQPRPFRPFLRNDRVSWKYGVKILGSFDLWWNYGIEVPRMLFEMHMNGEEVQVSGTEKGYVALWMGFCLRYINTEGNIEESIEKFRNYDGETFSSLLWPINYIVTHPEYNEIEFKKFIRVALERGKVVPQMLVLLAGSRFLKDERLKDEIVEMFKVYNQPGSIYLPYIGDSIFDKYPPAEPWSIERFVEEVSSVIVIDDNSYRESIYYLQKIWNYENIQFKNNLYKLICLILNIENIRSCVKKNILVDFAGKKYYSRELEASLDDIIEYAKEYRLLPNSVRIKEIVKTVLANNNFGLDRYNSLFPILTLFCP